ncbi:MAG: preprotein translocase subunit SecE [Puniceicoccales bacterium]|jgi:preprotein translocase subunit SecE|nr:preprotein translocase subunit SecE [Puniceicoccales bacterium]
MNVFRKARGFTKELFEELKKASWPNAKELRESTVMVLVGIVLLGVFVSLVDFSLFQIVSLCMKVVTP